MPTVAGSRPVTVMLTVATFDTSAPSLAWNVNESGPLYRRSGVYVRIAPEPDSVPCCGWSTISYVSGSPSRSVAWSGMSSGVSWATCAKLSSAAGGSLTGVTVDRNRSRVRAAVPVGDRVREAVAAVVVRLGRVEDTVTLDDRRAVRGGADGDHGQRVAVDVRVVREDVDLCRGILGERRQSLTAAGASLTGRTVRETVAVFESCAAVVRSEGEACPRRCSSAPRVAAAAARAREAAVVRRAHDRVLNGSPSTSVAGRPDHREAGSGQDRRVARPPPAGCSRVDGDRDGRDVRPVDAVTRAEREPFGAVVVRRGV